MAGQRHEHDALRGPHRVAVRHLRRGEEERLETYTGMRDGVLLHFTASMLAGLVTTTATNPVDMVKTQLYMDAGGGMVVRE